MWKKKIKRKTAKEENEGKKHEAQITKNINSL